eukprot:GILJ01011449.1.p1 GENE.GILJ01011449.1~~GILJ01011449.1.p1  ORF type:complete len:1212 (-),score=190.55 GILJ01011449.1:102-3737(-)
MKAAPHKVSKRGAACAMSPKDGASLNETNKSPTTISTTPDAKTVPRFRTKTTLRASDKKALPPTGSSSSNPTCIESDDDQETLTTSIRTASEIRAQINDTSMGPVSPSDGAGRPPVVQRRVGGMPVIPCNILHAGREILECHKCIVKPNHILFETSANDQICVMFADIKRFLVYIDPQEDFMTNDYSLEGKNGAPVSSVILTLGAIPKVLQRDFQPPVSIPTTTSTIPKPSDRGSDEEPDIGEPFLILQLCVEDFLNTYMSHIRQMYSDRFLSRTYHEIDRSEAATYFQRSSECRRKYLEFESKSVKNLKMIKNGNNGNATANERSVTVVENPNRVLLVYPQKAIRGAVSITVSDIRRLRAGEFLNDSIIDFYLKYLQFQVIPEHLRDRFYFFNTFFYKRLILNSSDESDTDAQRKVGELGYEHVRKWTQNVDLFEKQFIFVPINEHLHWSLAVICFPSLLINNNPKRLSNTESTTVNKSLHRTPTPKKSRALLRDSPEDEPTPESGSRAVVSKKQKKQNQQSSVLNQQTNRPYILVFDSLGMQKLIVVKTLRRYLELEYKDKYSKFRIPSGDYIKLDQEQPPLQVAKTPPASPGVFGELVQRVKHAVNHLLNRDESTSHSLEKGGLVPVKTEITDTTPPRELKLDAKSLSSYCPKVPSQDNHCDCGVFLLEYTEQFVKHPPPNYAVAKRFDHPEWFSMEDIIAKRRQIRNILYELSDTKDIFDRVIAEEQEQESDEPESKSNKNSNNDIPAPSNNKRTVSKPAKRQTRNSNGDNKVAGAQSNAKPKMKRKANNNNNNNNTKQSKTTVETSPTDEEDVTSNGTTVTPVPVPAKRIKGRSRSGSDENRQLASFKQIHAQMMQNMSQAAVESNNGSNGPRMATKEERQKLRAKEEDKKRKALQRLRIDPEDRLNPWRGSPRIDYTAGSRSGSKNTRFGDESASGANHPENGSHPDNRDMEEVQERTAILGKRGRSDHPSSAVNYPPIRKKSKQDAEETSNIHQLSGDGQAVDQSSAACDMELEPHPNGHSAPNGQGSDRYEPEREDTSSQHTVPEPTSVHISEQTGEQIGEQTGEQTGDHPSADSSAASHENDEWGVIQDPESFPYCLSRKHPNKSDKSRIVPQVNGLVSSFRGGSKRTAQSEWDRPISTPKSPDDSTDRINFDKRDSSRFSYSPRDPDDGPNKYSRTSFSDRRWRPDNRSGRPTGHSRYRGR